jgi:hypothetical protein
MGCEIGESISQAVKHVCELPVKAPGRATKGISPHTWASVCRSGFAEPSRILNEREIANALIDRVSGERPTIQK